MATDTRVYHSRHKTTGKVRLLRAISRASAYRHVAEDEFELSIASQDQLIDAMNAGVKVEDVKVEAEPSAT